MVKPLRFGVVTILGLLFSSCAGAQMRGGGGAIQMAPARQAAPMRMASPARTPAAFSSGMQLNRRASVIQVFPNQLVTPNSVFLPSSTLIADQVSVPGLGFDYAHLAAVSGNLRFNTPSFPVGRQIQDSGFITPVFFGGYPYYLGAGDYPPPQQQQPQVIVIQQPVPMTVIQQAAPSVSVDSNNNGAAAPAPSVAPAPVRDVGEFVLVRRDGKILFATVYSIIGSDLRYVTPEGIRRTLPMVELDADATRAMNEARGTILQF